MLFVFDFCLCSFHFWPFYNFSNVHVEAQKCVCTMPDTRTKNSNTFWIISSDLGVLLAYIILLMSDSSMNIDFLMNCFHSWFSLILLCSSFCFFWASLVWHMFESQFTMNKNERRHKSGTNITKFILAWILYWKFVVLYCTSNHWIEWYCSLFSLFSMAVNSLILIHWHVMQTTKSKHAIMQTCVQSFRWVNRSSNESARII